MPRLSDIQTFNTTIVPRDGKIHEHVLFLLILCRCCTSNVQLYRLPFYTHMEFLTQWWSFPVLSWKLILLVCHSTPVVVWIRSRRIAKPCETQYWPTMLWWYWAFVLIVRKWHSRTCRSVLDIEQPKVTLGRPVARFILSCILPKYLTNNWIEYCKVSVRSRTVIREIHPD